jgi:hypothetical protein
VLASWVGLIASSSEKRDKEETGKMESSKRQRTDAKGDFERWLHENGVDCSRIRFDDGDCGAALTNDRLAIAKQDTPPGTAFLSIPRKIVITEAIARDSAVGKAAVRFFAGIEPQTVLFLFIIDSRFRKEAFWGPYCRYLPSVYDDPLWFSTDTLRVLQGTNLGSALPGYRKSLREKYDRLFPALSLQQPHLFPAEWFTWEHFLWARSSYTSRGFTPKLMQSQASQELAPTLPSTVAPEDAESEQGECGCLMPGFDMLNHGYGTQITWFVDNEKGQVSFCSGGTATLKAGAEFKNNYGPKDNEHFLLNYGFCIEQNPVDTVVVKIGLQEGGRGGSPRALALRVIGKRHLLTVWTGRAKRKEEETVEGGVDEEEGKLEALDAASADISCAPSLLCAMRLCAMDDEEEYFALEPGLGASSGSKGVNARGVDEKEDRADGGMCVEHVLARARAAQVSDRCEFHVLQQLDTMLSAKLAHMPPTPPPTAPPPRKKLVSFGAVKDSSSGSSSASSEPSSSSTSSSSSSSACFPASVRDEVHRRVAQSYRVGQREVLQHSLRQVQAAISALQTNCRVRAQRAQRAQQGQQGQQGTASPQDVVMLEAGSSGGSGHNTLSAPPPSLVPLAELQPELAEFQAAGDAGKAALLSVASSAGVSSPSVCATPRATPAAGASNGSTVDSNGSTVQPPPAMDCLFTTAAVAGAGEPLLRLPLRRVFCIPTAMKIPGLGNALQLVQGLQNQAVGGADSDSLVVLLALALLFVRARLENKGRLTNDGADGGAAQAGAEVEGEAKTGARMVVTKDSLEAFYRRHEPSKLPLVPHILATFTVENLVEGLRKKYNEAPATELVEEGESMESVDGAAPGGAGGIAGSAAAAEAPVDVSVFFPFVEGLLHPPAAPVPQHDNTDDSNTNGDFQDALDLFPAEPSNTTTTASDAAASSGFTDASSQDGSRQVRSRCHAATLWSDRELEMLGLSPAGRQLRIEVEERQEQHRDMHTQLFPVLCDAMPKVFAPASCFDAERFLWAIAVVQDRAVWVHPPSSAASSASSAADAAPILCVLPLLVRPRPVSATAQNCRCELRRPEQGQGSEQEDFVELVTLGRMGKHTEVVAAPWWLQDTEEAQASCCNNDLLLYHGIALPSNPFDTVSIRIPEQSSVTVLAQPSAPSQPNSTDSTTDAIHDDGSGTATRGWGPQEVRACLAALQKHSGLEKNKRFKAVSKAVTAATKAAAKAKEEDSGAQVDGTAVEAKGWSKRECYDWCMRNLGATLDPERLLLASTEEQHKLARVLQLPTHHYLPFVAGASEDVNMTTAERGGQLVHVIPWALGSMAWANSQTDEECALQAQRLSIGGGGGQARAGKAAAAGALSTPQQHTEEEVQRARAVLERVIRYGQREWEGADVKRGAAEDTGDGMEAGGSTVWAAGDAQHRKALARTFIECHRTVWRAALARAAVWDGLPAKG